MADLTDVSNGIVALIAAALYPSGTGQPSVAGAPVAVFPGWPEEKPRDADMAAGKVQVSVFPQPNMERVTTRYPKAWQDVTLGVPVITAAVSGATILIAGTIRLGDIVMLVVAGRAYGYSVLATDTAASVATALAALLSVDMAATATNGVITLPATKSGRITSRTAAQNTIARELRRQQRGYQITIWAPTPALRSSTAMVVDNILSGTDRFTLPDGFACWLTYRASNDQDKQEAGLIYRRDIFFWAEYPTTEASSAYPVTAFVTSLAVIAPPSQDVTTSAISVVAVVPPPL